MAGIWRRWSIRATSLRVLFKTLKARGPRRAFTRASGGLPDQVKSHTSIYDQSRILKSLTCKSGNESTVKLDASVLDIPVDRVHVFGLN
jgi:hypothetical protein